TGSTPQNIDVGGGISVGALDLNDLELDHVTAGVLRIGRLDNAGNIVVTPNTVGTGGITAHAGFDTLSLRSRNLIPAADSTSTITVTNLAVQSANSTDLYNSATVLNSVGTLAASVTGSGSSFAFNNDGDLTIGTADGVSGITTIDGITVVTTFNGNIT